MKYFLNKLCTLLVLLFIVQCGSEVDNSPQPTQVGYFKSTKQNHTNENQRVFTFKIDHTFNELQIRRHAEKTMNTSGRNTWAYYYLGETPNPTLATSLDRALDIAESEKYSYQYIKFADGSSVFNKLN